eukprot:6466995-Amphidinium_carterae.1
MCAEGRASWLSLYPFTFYFAQEGSTNYLLLAKLLQYIVLEWCSPKKIRGQWGPSLHEVVVASRKMCWHTWYEAH